MKKIKKALMIVAMAALVLSPNAMAEEKGECKKMEFEEASNPILGAILVPIRMALVFMHLPRCLIHHFPTNDPEESEDK